MCNLVGFDKYIESCNHYYSQAIGHYDHLRSFPVTPDSPSISSTSCAWQPLLCFCRLNFAFSRILCKWNSNEANFYNWFLSLSIVSSSIFVCTSNVCSFHCWVVFPFMAMPQLVHPFTRWSALELLPAFGL